jgi:hypothetical protein
MSSQINSSVQMFGALHTIRKERGQKSTVEIGIPAGGCTARALAEVLNLPLDKIEGVFINHRAHSIGHMIQPGDRVGFIPKGIPAPERVLLGIHGAV